MFRLARTVLGRTNTAFTQGLVSSVVHQGSSLRNEPVTSRLFSVLSNITSKPMCMPSVLKGLQPQVSPAPQLECVPIRTVTKFSLRQGTRKSVKAPLFRFFRLHWGGWIRTRCGRHKKMHKKRANLKRRLRQHVLVNSTQALLLDKMVTKFWKRPKHYINDIYEPYHTRTFYDACRKPMPYPDQPLKKPLSAYQLAKGNY